MSIKEISKTWFLGEAKEILRQNSITRDIITWKKSLREDLDLTSIDIAELLIGLEERFNVKLDWVDMNNINNMRDVYNAFNKSLQNKRDDFAAKTSEKQINSILDVFKIVNQLINEKYGVYFAKPESNWYKDLGLSDFQWAEFRESLEEKLNIKIPFFYFENIDKLCNVIFAEIKKKSIDGVKQSRIKQLFVRTK